jgi:hypothetical protein
VQELYLEVRVEITREAERCAYRMHDAGHARSSPVGSYNSFRTHRPTCYIGGLILSCTRTSTPLHLSSRVLRQGLRHRWCCQLGIRCKSMLVKGRPYTSRPFVSNALSTGKIASSAPQIKSPNASLHRQSSN